MKRKCEQRWLVFTTEMLSNRNGLAGKRILSIGKALTFDNIVGYEVIKRAFLRSLNSKASTDLPSIQIQGIWRTRKATHDGDTS
ncbi:MAG: hypothetical protein WAM14_03515 [Candidatus Nitrosopolaris sp.]